LNPKKGPQFERFALPIVEILKDMGFAGNASEVLDRVIERLKISEAEQAETTSTGQSRVRNQIAWARFYLVKAGLLASPRRGVWALTQAGRTAKLNADAVHALFKNIPLRLSRNPGAAEATTAGDETGDADLSPAEDNYSAELLSILRSLPPAGFERICQRLLMEHGIDNVVVTGRSGDGGIDGVGVLVVNAFVSFKVVFQCKRFKEGGRVGPGHVRDFRGAMAGTAEKGILITTATFTIDAKAEACKSGVPPIELVDQDQLVSLFEKAQLGLVPRQTFDVNREFFNEFRT